MLLLLVATLHINAQAPAVQWQKSFGEKNLDYDIQRTTDGGYIVAKRSGPINGGYTWIIKFNSFGTIVWKKKLGRKNILYEILYGAKSVQQTSDGGYVVAGYTWSSYHGDNCWIIKFNYLGTIVWKKSLGGSDFDIATSIQQTTDGGYIVAGGSDSNDGDVTGNHGGSDYWIVKLNSSGTIEWQKSLGGSDDDLAYSIQQTTDGGYIVAGCAHSNDGDITGHHGSTRCTDYWIVKLSSSGTIEWQKSLGGNCDDIAEAIQQTSDGGYVVAGRLSSNDGDGTEHHGSNGTSDYWIVKLNSSGTIEWQKSLGGSGNDGPCLVWQTSDSGYIITGYSWSTDGDVIEHQGPASSGNYWIVKLGYPTRF